MSFRNRIAAYQQKLIQHLKGEQSSDGSWRYPCENGPLTDSYMIIILRNLKIDNEESFIHELSQRLLSTQQPNGAWKLYEDEKDGNLSATIEACTALMFTGNETILNSENMRKASQFILSKGGFKQAHVSTKFMLAINGLYPWPTIFPIPLSLLLLPRYFSPVNFHGMTSYVRVHFAAILIVAHKRFTIRNKWTPELTHLIKENVILERLIKQQNTKHSFFQRLKRFFPPTILQNRAMRKAETYVFEKTEGDGTLNSYATATFYMIYSLLALGYDAQSSIIGKAIDGLKQQTTTVNGYKHIQNASSTIWDTSLISYALQKSGQKPSDADIRKATIFLLERQHPIQNRQQGKSTGAWSFSENNVKHPDVDDTQAALRATYSFSQKKKVTQVSWGKGLAWLVSMQNNDGGWSSFEKNKGSSLITRLPIENIKDTVVDPSTADLTGRTLDFLGKYSSLKLGDSRIDRANHFLLSSQEMDGSWYGRWGVCYIYGTWAAVTGLCATGVPTESIVIQRATHWLESVQNEDGGWGESCKSDVKKKFCPLPFSTPSQTAWALDALIAVYNEPTPAIKKGMEFLIKNQGNNTDYPTGGGLPGHFYIHYHSYNYIWPLLTISNYLSKYEKDDIK